MRRKHLKKQGRGKIGSKKRLLRNVVWLSKKRFEHYCDRMGRSKIIRSVYVPRSAGAAAALAEEGRGCECCGVCRVCTCLRWGVLTTPTGIVKGCQLVKKNIYRVMNAMLFFFS